jgi:nitrogen fixation protein FixH
MSLSAPKSFRLTGWHVLVGVTAFFALIVGTDLWFMVLAYRTFPGQTAANPYEAGIAFNQTLSRRESQARLGWSVAAQALPAKVRVMASDSAGRPLGGLKVDATFERPATETGRRLTSLKEVGPGVYEAPGLDIAGAWDVTVTLTDPDGHAFEAQRRLLWPSPTSRPGE